MLDQQTTALDDPFDVREQDHALQPGAFVEYVGVVNDELDLERRGVVQDGPKAEGDFLISWRVVGDVEQRSENPASLEVLQRGVAHSL